jgi:hypothetical protein
LELGRTLTERKDVIAEGQAEADTGRRESPTS